jgi:hypothetical protein
MRRGSLLAWIALLACSQPSPDSGGEPRSTQLEPKPTEPKPTEPPTIPNCGVTPTITPMSTTGSPTRTFFMGGQLAGDRMLAYTHKHGAYSVYGYDFATDTWSGPVDELFADYSDVAAFAYSDAKRLVIVYETEDKTAARKLAVFEFDSMTWWRMPDGLVPAGNITTLLAGDTLLVAPNRGCAFIDWTQARAITLDPAHPSMRTIEAPAGFPRPWASEVSEVAGQQLVLWGGQRTDAETDSLDCEPDTSEPVDEAWILELPDARWRKVAGGPKRVGDYAIDLMLDDALLVAPGTTTGWRLDVASGTWRELGSFDAGLFPAEADLAFSSLLTLRVGSRGLFLRTLPSGSEGVVITGDELRTLPRGPTTTSVAVELVLDDDRLVLLPRDKRITSPQAYLLDTAAGTWCALDWLVPEHHWTDKGAPYYRVTAVVQGRGWLWAPGSDREGEPSSGLAVTIPRPG